MPTGISHGVHHRDGRMHIDGEPIIRAIEQLSVIATSTPKEDELLLIGRRELRSNNSWLHNVASLMTGRDRCWLMVHPSDAARWGLQDGQEACLESRVHRGTVPIKITEDVRPGVVSLPHGYGHASSRDWQKVAGSRPGVSANDWTDDERVETVVGQSILNGVPVRLKPATSTAPHSPRESARV
jgi:anaerobic selenocysteine-containing dehydrogenase